MHPLHFALTHNSNVVFCCTSHRAGSATNTGVKIDTHSPLGTRIWEVGIQSSFHAIIAGFLCIRFHEVMPFIKDYVWILLELTEGQFFHDIGTALILIVCLGVGNLLYFFSAGVRNVRHMIVKGCTVETNPWVDVLSHISSGTTNLLIPSVTHSHRNYIGVHTGDHKDREFQFFIARFQSDHGFGYFYFVVIIKCNAQFFCCCKRDDGIVVPGSLGDRIR